MKKRVPLILVLWITNLVSYSQLTREGADFIEATSISIHTQYLNRQWTPNDHELIATSTNANVLLSGHEFQRNGPPIKGKIEKSKSTHQAVNTPPNTHTYKYEKDFDSIDDELIIEHLGPTVNSEYREYNGILSPDGKTLYFSRKNHPKNVGGVKDDEDIWYTTLDENGKWKESKNMGAPFNNDYPNYINAILSNDRNDKSIVMILGNQYIKGGKKMKEGMSISHQINGQWVIPKPLTIEKNYNHSSKQHYFVTNNSKVLLMALHRDDSYGELDLYVSFCKNDSVWGEPINLGKNINSVAEEASPFLAADNKTLYFSSSGFEGKGGLDIYKSTRLDDTWTNWSNPQNLSSKLNTVLDDLFFHIPLNSEYAYFSREVSENNTDIFTLKLPAFMLLDSGVLVKGKTIDAQTGKPISSQVTFESLTSKSKTEEVQSNPETGEYEIRLAAGKEYKVRSNKSDENTTIPNLDLRKVIYGPVNHEIYVTQKPTPPPPPNIERTESIPANVNEIASFENLVFDFNKETLNAASIQTLDKVADLMIKSDSLEIELIGHTDTIGSERYNKRLSKTRVKGAANYLIKKGVDKRNMKTSYFGETKPIDFSNTPEGHMRNRRVEFVLTKRQ